MQHSLFGDETNPSNFLPIDGNAFYFGKIFSDKECRDWFEIFLKKISWQQDEVIIYGKKIITARKMQWYADTPVEYEYSKVRRTARIFTEELISLKNKVEQKTEAIFNSCLLNLYHSGDEGMGWHSDSENSLVKDAPIAALSFGAERKMSFKHKHSKETVSVFLENGSLLLMGKDSQTNWMHSIPKTKKVSEPRISLTFRLMK